MQNSSSMRPVVIAALIASFAGGYGVSQLPIVASAHAAAPATGATSGTLPGFADLVDQEGQAVVSVHVTRQMKMGANAPQIPRSKGDEEFGEFFKRSPMPLPPDSAEGMPAEGRGSGFVVSSDGYVLTNAHVVANAAEVIITLPDKREFTAKVVGSDRRTDIALLKVDAKDLPMVRIGDPNKTRVGEWVAAIGAPFGLDNTVTAGIVSAKSRSLPSDGYVPFIQTDVAVNPGNSGGPLFNLNGEVIGINSQIYSRTGGYMGLSFAIPIDVAMKVKDQLQQYGKVTRGRLGVVIQDLNKELAESFALGKTKGALVSSVEKGGPAEAAGLQPGDIVVKVDNQQIEKSVDLSRLIGDMKRGQSAKLSVWRNGSTKEFSITLTEMPADQALSNLDSSGVTPAKLGVVVRPLTPEEQGRIGEAGGVMVEQASGVAARAGIKAGDVILALNSQRVTSPEELKKLAEKSGKTAALLVERDGTRLYIPLTIG